MTENSTQEIEQKYRERIASDRRIKLYAKERMALIADFIALLGALDDESDIQQACNDAIAFLRQGYKDTSIGGDLLPKYREAIEEAIANGNLPQWECEYTHTNPLGEISQRTADHPALKYLRFSVEEYGAIRERAEPTPEKLERISDLKRQIATLKAQRDEARSQLAEARAELSDLQHRVSVATEKLLSRKESKRMRPAERCPLIFQALCHYNSHRDDERIAINQSLLERYFGIHRNVARQFIIENRKAIAKHHKAMGIENPRSQNRGKDLSYFQKFVRGYLESSA